MTGRGFPEGAQLEAQLGKRRRRGVYVKISFLASLMVAVFALLTLLYNIINSAFGLVALESEVDPATLVREAGLDSSVELADLAKDELVVVLQANVNNNVGRRLEREQRFYDDRLVFESESKWAEICSRQEDRPAGCSGDERDRDGIYAVVVEQIVQPQARQTWSLVDSILRRSEIEAEAAAQYPQADLVFRSWLSMDFVTSPQSPQAEVAGVRTAILGSLWIVLVTILFSFPIGVAAAVYLEE